MKPLRPRALCHRGRVPAVGFLLDARHVGPAERLGRVLSLWEPGCALRALSDDLWLLRLARPRSVDARTAPGTPLCVVDGDLCAVPLSDDERAGVSTELGPSLLWPVAGSLHQIAQGAGSELDPADHVELGALRVVELSSLAAPPPEVTLRPVLAARDTREVLGDAVAPPAAAQREMLRSLMSSAEDAGGARRDPRTPQLAARATASLSMLWHWVRRTLVRLRSLLQRNPVSASAEHHRPRAPAATDAPMPTRPPLLARLTAALRSRLAWLAMSSRLGSLLSRRQARYMRDMLAMFERRDLSEALRHAIPLAEQSAEPRKPAPPTLGGLSPRGQLSIGSRRIESSSSLYFGDDLFAHLQQTYRQAARRLEQEGKFFEAAFVYAELLRDPRAAVTLLERAKLWRQAAELAQGHGLPPALVVQLWFMAKDVERAVAYAVQHDAFADAIAGLARRDRRAAEALRLTWARRLAESGRYMEAVEAIWPLVGARHLAVAWMDRVIADGGVSGARMLGRALSLGPAEMTRYDGALERLLQEPGHQGALCRAAFAGVLTQGSGGPSQAARRCAAATLRAVVRDAGLGLLTQNRVVRRRLERLSLDRALVVDLPSSSEIRSSAAPLEPLSLRWTDGDRGSLVVKDLAPLPNGGFLLALGESGTRVITRAGRTRVHFDQPADYIVLADNGWRALGVGHRGALRRITRIDLLRARAAHWVDVELSGLARDFDGDSWFVRRGGEVLRIDTLSDGFEASFRVADPAFEDSVVFDRSGDRVQLLVHGASEVWEYQSPAMVLRQRRAFELPDPKRTAVHATTIHASGKTLLHVVSYADEGHGRLHLVSDHLCVTLGSLKPDDLLCAVVQAAGNWAVVSYVAGGDAGLLVVALATQRVIAQLTAQGSTSLIEVHLKDGLLVAADQLGRLVEIDLERVRVNAELRLFA